MSVAAKTFRFDKMKVAWGKDGTELKKRMGEEKLVRART